MRRFELSARRTRFLAYCFAVFVVACVALLLVTQQNSSMQKPFSFETSVASYLVEPLDEEQDSLVKSTRITSSIAMKLSELEERFFGEVSIKLPRDRCGTSLEISQPEMYIDGPSRVGVIVRGNGEVFHCVNTKVPLVSCRDTWISLPFGGKAKGPPICQQTFQNNEIRNLIISTAFERRHVADLTNASRPVVENHLVSESEIDKKIDTIIEEAFTEGISIIRVETVDALSAEISLFGFSEIALEKIEAQTVEDAVELELRFTASYPSNQFEEIRTRAFTLEAR